MIEERIVTALTGHAGLAALIGNRVYPQRMSQGATFPALVYTRVSGERLNNLDGDNIQNPRFQVDCLAESYSGAKAVAAQVELAFKAATFPSVFIADRDDNDDATDIYLVSMDFSVWSI